MRQTPVETSALAIISLVFGILAWTVLPLLAAVIAIITGHLARSQIRAAHGDLQGDGLAVAGLGLGYLNLALFMLGLVLLGLFGVGLLAWLASTGLTV